MDKLLQVTPKKESKVATKELDVSSMSYAQLQNLINQASAVIDGKRKEELKEICALFVESLESKGFSKAEGVTALGAGKAKGGAASKGSKIGFPKELWGKSFKSMNGEIWTKSKTGKGRPPLWLMEAVTNGKKWEDFLVQ